MRGRGQVEQSKSGGPRSMSRAELWGSLYRNEPLVLELEIVNKI